MTKKKYPNSTDFNDYFNTLIETDSSFKKEWDDFQIEYSVMKAVIHARIQNQLSQKDLSLLSGINQSEISKIENGVRNPSMKVLQKLADAMNMRIKIEFVPKDIK